MDGSLVRMAAAFLGCVGTISGGGGESAAATRKQKRHYLSVNFRLNCRWEGLCLVLVLTFESWFQVDVTWLSSFLFGKFHWMNYALICIFVFASLNDFFGLVGFVIEFSFSFLLWMCRSRCCHFVCVSTIAETRDKIQHITMVTVMTYEFIIALSCRDNCEGVLKLFLCFSCVGGRTFLYLLQVPFLFFSMEKVFFSLFFLSLLHHFMSFRRVRGSFLLLFLDDILNPDSSGFEKQRKRMTSYLQGKSQRKYRMMEKRSDLDTQKETDTCKIYSVGREGSSL